MKENEKLSRARISEQKNSGISQNEYCKNNKLTNALLAIGKSGLKKKHL